MSRAWLEHARNGEPRLQAGACDWDGASRSARQALFGLPAGSAVAAQGGSAAVAPPTDTATEAASTPTSVLSVDLARDAAAVYAPAGRNVAPARSSSGVTSGTAVASPMASGDDAPVRSSVAHTFTAAASPPGGSTAPGTSVAAGKILTGADGSDGSQLGTLAERMESAAAVSAFGGAGRMLKQAAAELAPWIAPGFAPSVGAVGMGTIGMSFTPSGSVIENLAAPVAPFDVVTPNAGCIGTGCSGSQENGGAIGRGGGSGDSGGGSGGSRSSGAAENSGRGSNSGSGCISGAGASVRKWVVSSGYQPVGQHCSLFARKFKQPAAPAALAMALSCNGVGLGSWCRVEG